MRRLARLLFPVLFLMTAVAGAEPVSVQHLRVWRAPDHTRLVFDVSGPLEHRLFTLQNPDRLVVDIDNARMAEPLKDVDTDGPLVGAVRVGQPEAGPLRIVLELTLEELDLRGAALSEALHLIATQAGVNIYLDAGLDQPVDASFPAV